MSSRDIVQAAYDVLRAAIPDADVLFGIPDRLTGPVAIYLWHEGSAPSVPKATGVLQHHHTIGIRLMVLATADPQEAELVMLDRSDRVRDAFLASKAARTLNGAAASVQPLVQAGGSVAYVTFPGGTMYRQRGWQMDATEYQTYDWS